MKTSRLTAALCFTLCAVFTPIYAADAVKSTEVTRDKIGQDVVVEGKTSSFRASRGERSPNSFMLKDAAGEIRIVIWPDVFSKIANSAALQTDGTTVKVQAEVAEYREKVELHVRNASNVTVGTASGGTTATVTGAGTTTGTR